MALGELIITFNSFHEALLVKTPLPVFDLRELHAIIKCASKAKLNWMNKVTSKDVLLSIHSYHDEWYLFFSSL